MDFAEVQPSKTHHPPSSVIESGSEMELSELQCQNAHEFMYVTLDGISIEDNREAPRKLSSILETVESTEKVAPTLLAGYEKCDGEC